MLIVTIIFYIICSLIKIHLKMKNVISVFVFMLIAFVAQAQDTLILKNGQELKVKVLEILSTEIKYKPSDNLDGPVYQVNKPLVYMIKFANGKKEFIEAAAVQTPTQTPTNNQNLATPPQVVNNNPNSENLCDKGTADAKVNYKGQNCGAGWVSATSVLLSPLAGVIAGSVIASTPPQMSNLNVPNQSLMTNAQYAGCYQGEAHKIKKKGVWTGVGIGSATWLLLLLLL
jgi:hypothetical protein